MPKPKRNPPTAAVARAWAARARKRGDFTKAAQFDEIAMRLTEAAADTWRNRADLA